MQPKPQQKRTEKRTVHELEEGYSQQDQLEPVKRKTRSEASRTHPKPNSHNCHGQSHAAVPLFTIPRPPYDITCMHRSKPICDTSVLWNTPTFQQSLCFHAIPLYNPRPAAPFYGYYQTPIQSVVSNPLYSSWNEQVSSSRANQNSNWLGIYFFTQNFVFYKSMPINFKY